MLIFTIYWFNIYNLFQYTPRNTNQDPQRGQEDEQRAASYFTPLAKIENGDRTPTLDELKIISKEFDIDPAVFFDKPGQTVIIHGNNSQSIGTGSNNSFITIDKELLDALVRVLDKLTRVLDKE